MSQIKRSPEFAIRLNSALTELGWPKRGRTPALRRALAKRGIKVTDAACFRWLTGAFSPEKDKMMVIADIIGKSAGFLFTGEESNSLDNQSNQTTNFSVPLLSINDAKKHLHGDICSNIYTKTVHSQNSLSDRAFAIQYTGDAMTSNTTPRSYPKGAILIFDFGEIDRFPVRVLFPVGDDVIFRELDMDAGQPFLKPLNPYYRSIPVSLDSPCAILKEYFFIDE